MKSLCIGDRGASSLE